MHSCLHAWFTCLHSHPCRVIKTPEIANLALLGFGDIFALLFDNRYLYILDLWTESLISRWPLPEYRKSKRGSSFLAGEASWLNGLDGHNDTGLVFATSMPDHSIHLVLWKEHGWLWRQGCGFGVQPLAANCMNQSSHLMVSSRNAQSCICLPGPGLGAGGSSVDTHHSTRRGAPLASRVPSLWVSVRGCIWGSSFICP